MEKTSPSLKKRGILVAKTLYKVGEEKLPLRVMNVTDKSQILHKNTCAGTAETAFHDDILSSINDQAKCVSLKQNPWRIPLSLMQKVNDELQRMMDNIIIRPSISPWSSPIVVVRNVTIQYVYAYISVALMS